MRRMTQLTRGALGILEDVADDGGDVGGLSGGYRGLKLGKERG